MQYKKFQGIVLKKQNYREADQIITVWTEEAGKIRCLAKGLRLPKSKLAYSLQDLSHVAIEVAGRNLPTLISAQVLQQFQTLCEDLKKAAIAFYAAELMLKITADESPNAQSFAILKDFLHCLDDVDYSVRYYPLLESFSLKLLESLGFSIEHAGRSFDIPAHLSPDLAELGQREFAQFVNLNMESDRMDQLHHLINRFVEYILERNIKSEPFLISIS